VALTGCQQVSETRSLGLDLGHAGEQMNAGKPDLRVALTAPLERLVPQLAQLALRLGTLVPDNVLARVRGWGTVVA
jgi:hypothetical protein